MLFDLRYSIRNLYKADAGLFDNMTFPNSNIDKSAVIHAIIHDFGDFGLASPIVDFKDELTAWSTENKYTISHLWDSINISYNPIDNYDRTEHTETHGTAEGKSAGYNSSELKTDTGADNDTYIDSYVHGNIGVTTTMQMLQSERETVMFNFYKTIAKMFANDFLVCVY